MMKKKSVIFIVLLILLLIITFFLFFGFLRNSRDREVKGTQYSYVVKEYKGKIGVFKSDEKNPFEVLDVSVLMLPAFDQTELKSGILIENDSQLQSILEDFTS